MKNRNTESGKKSRRFVLTGRALSVSTPCIMGILNVTPDSFSDGGKFDTVTLAMRRIEQLIREGAAIIDIGGESTRPGSEPVPLSEELQRVIPVLEKAVSAFPETMFSIDTTKYKVAHEALGCGVQMVNDISGLRKEPELAGLCAQYDAALVIMHSRETPKTMQDRPEYRDVNQEILEFLMKSANFAREQGVSQIVIDPGIGFGKTVNHNLEIIAQLNTFTNTAYPVMIGASRKSVIGQILADKNGPRPVENRLAGTLALHYHALMQGVAILRVHDVREAHDSLEIFKAITKIEN